LKNVKKHAFDVNRLYFKVENRGLSRKKSKKQKKTSFFVKTLNFCKILHKISKKLSFFL